MLRFFQDWNQPDDYDKGMGSELFSNVQVFPKHAFVNLTIALATAPIRGLTKLNTNLYLFDLNDSELVNWAEKGMPDQGGDSPIAFAAITDIINQVHSRVTSSEDLARFILAIDEFLSATEGIENTQATVINPPFVKEKENLNSLLEGRRLLKLMVAGVSNILTSRLQDKDGGMWDYFDLDKKEVVREERGRSLKTQLYVIEALLKNYELWGGRGAHLAALESYHFINNALFDENMGVYRAYEKEGDLGLRPQDYLQLIRVLKKISHYHFDQESKKQAERLMRFYENHWLEWIKK